MKDAVTVRVNAPASKVWALVSDVTRIGEFSPETVRAEWVGDAPGPALGARFRGQVRRNGKGPTYWSMCEVTDCEPGKAFGFAVVVKGKTINKWRYELADLGDATDVTESFELADTVANRTYWSLAGRWRAKTNSEGMRTTLERMKALLEDA